MKRLLIGLALVVGTLRAFATDYYVSTTGDDGNDGTSRDAALATIAKAVSKADAGDTIHVLAGLYEVAAPRDTDNAAIVVEKGVTIIGDTGDPADVVVRNTAGGLTKTSHGNNDGVHRVFKIGHASAVLSSLTVEGGKIGGEDKQGGNIRIGSAGGTVTNCIIRNAILYGNGPGGYAKTSAGGAGIYCSSDKGLITHCVITNNFGTRGTSGISVSSSGGSAALHMTKGVIRDSLIAYNTGSKETYGKAVYLSGKGTLMENCTLAANCLEGDEGDYYPIMIGLGANNTGTDNNPIIRNTLFYGNAGASGAKRLFADAWLTDVANRVSTYCFKRIQDCATDAPIPTDANLKMITTGIAVTDDFHPSKASSSIVDACTKMNSPVTLDLDGNPRVFNDVVDIGCYEYSSEGPAPVADPEFVPPSSVFTAPIEVTLTCDTDGATIRYTTDGSEPTEESAAYAGPIAVADVTTTVRARAYKAGMEPSDVVSATYTYEAPQPPVIGTVKVMPQATKATLAGTIVSVGNNGATSCDVYLALGEAAATKVASGVTSAFKCAITDLEKATAYAYTLSVSNNAVTVLGAATGGTFTTRLEDESFDYCVSPEGDDANDGTSRDAPFATIAKAVESAEDGQVICLLAGTYEVSKAVSVAKALTLVGETGNPADVIVRNTAGWVTPTSWANADGAHRVFEINNAGAVLSGLAVEGGKVGGSGDFKGGNILIDANGGTVTNCIIRNAIMCANTPGGAAKTGSGGAGIASLSAKGLVTHCVITNNYASRGKTDIGLSQWGGAVAVHIQGGGTLRDSLIAYNTTRKDNGASVVFVGNANTLVENCTIAANGVLDEEGELYSVMYFAAVTGSGQNPFVRNTLIYGNTGKQGSKKLFADAWVTAYGSKPGAYDRFVSCATDAELPTGLTMVNSGISFRVGGFRPTGASSVVNAGAERTSPVARDLAGNPRVLDGAVDIGCYEYNAEEAAPVDNPVFAPASGSTFYPTTNVTITCTTDGATIRYTTDGSEPTEASTAYEAPIPVGETVTVRARAYKADKDPSEIVSATYTFEQPVPPELGEVKVTPRATKATLVGSILSVGNNYATSCDVYLTIGEGAMTKVASGVTSAFKCVITNLTAETTYAYTLSVSNNAMIVLGAETDGSFTTKAVDDPFDYCVSPSGDDAQDGTSRETAFATVAKAVSVAEKGETVCLLAGTYEVTAPVSVDKAITVVGETGNPADVIVRNVAGGAFEAIGACRVFEIDDPDAVVSGLAVEGGKIGGAGDNKGGNILIDTKGGTVTNCIIRNATMKAFAGGYPKTAAGGAGIASYSDKGVITHCVITNNFATRNSTEIGFGSWGGAAAVHLQGGGVLRESLIAYNVTTNDSVGSAVFLGGPGTLMENCTIAGNGSLGNEGTFYPVMFYPAVTGANQNPLLRNTLFYGNAGGTDGNKLFADAWVDYYAENPAVLANAYVRFVNCATDALLPEGLTMLNGGFKFKGGFRPAEGCSVIDAGSEMLSPVARDLQGRPRIVRRAVDIGCYEAGPSGMVIIIE